MAYTYTTQEFEEIKQKYLSGTSVEQIAQDYNKSVPSVRMKLVKAGIYQKKTATKEAAVTTKPVKSTQTKAENLKHFKDMFTCFGPALV